MPEKTYQGPSLPKIGHGGECWVYRYSPNLVLKVYRSKFHRDRAHARQKKAYLKDFAPPTQGKLRYGKSWGYLSSRAELYDIKQSMRLKDMLFLEKKMKAIGLSPNDVCEVNAGYYKGRLVVIDFGDISTVYCEDVGIIDD